VLSWLISCCSYHFISPIQPHQKQGSCMLIF